MFGRSAHIRRSDVCPNSDLFSDVWVSKCRSLILNYPPRFIPFLLLARAYYLSSSHDPDNLDKAEASLNELIDTIDSAADRVSPVY